MNHLEINAPIELAKKVRQTLKFKTGKFVWKVKFNIPLNVSSVNNTNIFVMDENNNILKTNISYNDSSGEIEIMPIEPYAKDVVYFLHITNKVTSKSGKRLNKEIKLNFKL